MKIAIVQFPGSNCERETRLAVKRAGMQPVDFLWNESTDDFDKFAGFIVVGGFSYEDRSRAGIIASLDKVVGALQKQAAAGKPVLGICNGAQILVESGMVPGCNNNELAMALAMNKRILHDKVVGTGFYNAWVHIKANENATHNAFTSALSNNEFLHIPVAHAEGRFLMPQELLEKLQSDGQVVFQYCNEVGEIKDEFPVNPNGSMANIAAISNYAGNVMAIMPHPERVECGDAIFASMRDYIAEKEEVRAGELSFSLPSPVIVDYKTQHNELLVDYVIADNQALTVQNTLKQLNIPVSVKRLTHWEVDCVEPVLVNISETEELINPRKEFEVKLSEVKSDNTIALLVRSLENIVGQQKFELLANHFEVDGIKSINRGDVWLLTADSGDIQEHIEKIISTNILSNPYAQECFYYH